MASPQLAQALAMDARNREAAGVTLDQFDVEAARASLPDLGLPLPEGLRIEAAAMADVTAFWVVPAQGDGRRRIVYFHGGGFVAGSLDSHRSLVAWLAHEAGAALLFVDYGLAPEHVFPSQVEEAHAALQWAAANGPTGPGEAERLVVAGDSAGAAIAVAALLLARERSGPNVDAAILLCGMLDLDARRSAFAASSIRMRGMISAYLGSRGDVADPLACPARADLSRLPPMIVQTGTEDGCRSDCEAFVARAQAAGVAADITVWADMFHVWHRFAPMLPEAREALAQAGRFAAGRP